MFNTLEKAAEEVRNLRRETLHRAVESAMYLQKCLQDTPENVFENAMNLGYLEALLKVEGVNPELNHGYVRTAVKEAGNDPDFLNGAAPFTKAMQSLNKLIVMLRDLEESV